MEPPAEGAHVLLPDDRRPEKNRTNDRDQFCPYSLEDWIAAAERAAVPHVPATRVAMFEREDLRHHEYYGPHQQRLDEAFADVARARTGDVMMRWDCCATAELKAAMSDRSENGPPPREIRQALAVDHRLLEILDEFPRIGVPVWRRPWLGAEIVIEGGWPIEYRAFVKNGELTGISSYYVQRPLPRRDDEIEAVRTLTRKLLTEVHGPCLWPPKTHEQLIIPSMLVLMGKKPKPDRPLPDEVHATIDFVVTTDGVLMLEGGPPWFMGADPCCFEPGAVEGLALQNASKSTKNRSSEKV